MGSSKDRKPAKASAQRKTRDGPPNDAGRTWWQKPFVWLGGVFLTALAASLTGALQAMFSFLVGAITPEPPKPGGDPLSAVVSLKPVPDDVSLPRTRTLSGQDLQSLSDLKPHEQAAWLEKQGGIPLGPRTLTMALKSNRSHVVRVTDIRPVSECEEPSRGSLVRTGLGGRGQVVDSTVILLYVGDPSRGAEVPGEGETAEPYFPGRTITLTGPEEEFLVLSLMPSETELCRSQIELTVVDGDTEVRQTITGPGGKKIPLLPYEEAEQFEADYSAVYLAGNICKRPVLASEDYFSDVRAACGPGNYVEPKQIK